MNKLIAVTGAGGQVGRRVAARLADRGAKQRLVVRDRTRAPEIDDAEVRAAPSYGDERAMRQALEGVDRLFLIPGTEALDRAAQQASAVRAAVAAGVEHITYLSFVKASTRTRFPLAFDHGHTEQRIRETGLPFTFLRMNLFMDFVPAMVGADGVLRGPAGEGRVAVVSRDDVADVAAAVLTEDGYDGQTYDLTGPQEHTLAEMAAILTKITGQPVRYHDETLEEAYETRRALGEPWEVEAWVGSYLAVNDGVFAGVSDTVLRIAGHPPISLEDFLRTHRPVLASDDR